MFHIPLKYFALSELCFKFSQAFSQSRLILFEKFNVFSKNQWEAIACSLFISNTLLQKKLFQLSSISSLRRKYKKSLAEN